MSLSRLLLLLSAGSLAALTACSRPQASAGPDPRPSVAAGQDRPSAVAAEVDGVPITWAELEEEAATPLTRLRQEEYEIRRQVLDDLVARRLVEAAARNEGISSEELLRQNVEESLPKPPAAQLEEIYQRNQDRFAGQTREQALARIAELLRERAAAERRRDFEQALREKAQVTVHLDPPRVAVEVPEDASATGPKDAPVTIVEFTDYQCPFCHRAQGVIEQVLDRYPGKVRLVHLDFPLENHPGALPAARAARCAGEQGRFWDYHRSLMTQKGSLDQVDLARRAAALDLDPREFGKCLASDRHLEAIRSEAEQGSALGVTGTPAYFINGRMVSGAQPFPAFAEIIDEELLGGG